MTTLRILIKTESYVVYSTTARSSHDLTQSSELLVRLTISFCTFRSTYSLPFDRSSNPHLVERTSCFYSFLVASIKQQTSNVSNLKPPIYDTFLSTLFKVQDKVCSIKCSKLTSLLRLLALALTKIISKTINCNIIEIQLSNMYKSRRF